MDDQEKLHSAEAVMAPHLAGQQEATAHALRTKIRQNRFFLGASLFVLSLYASYIAYRYFSGGKFDLISGFVLVLLCTVAYKRWRAA